MNIAVPLKEEEGYAVPLDSAHDDTTSESVQSGLKSDDDSQDEAVEDMAYYERAIEEIRHGDSYICMICTVEMDHQCQVYPCTHCYRVFDYDCIREWALKSTERTLDKTWKCPNCSHVNEKVPAKNRATCWCGKVVNPDPNQLNPNSCGQTCNANICIHGCSKICHLGPHPECTRMMSIQCRCGKNSKVIPCFQSKQYRGKRRYQCDEECGLLLPCGIHKCKKKCHSGLCGPCPEKLKSNKEKNIEIKCYCGSHSMDYINCKDVQVVNDSKLSKNKEGDTWIGVYSCKEVRTVKYSCHKHSFVEKCVAPPTISGKLRCPFSPELLKTCPCGKTSLVALSTPRTKCTDPIPHCESRCGKPLKCGKHTCPFTCHEGSCMDPCTQIHKVKCSCEKNTFLVPCQFEDKPHCNIKCESLMSCRRHRCSNRCCSGRPLAEIRKKTIFRTADLADETLVEPEHVCLQDCNLMTSCGKHACKRKCHPGKCPSCLESDSNDLECPCGKTIVPAPVRCGTKLPPCPYQCIKVVSGESECGHPPMPHTCHPLELPCPPCTATVFKTCKCGKNEKFRTVCFQNDVSCGKICGESLDICDHTCQKKCHLPGECQTKCKQVCRRKRVGCDHLCPRACHGKTECPDTPCTAIIKIYCACGRREKEVVCGASANVPSETKDETLPCDDECEILKRHQQLMAAFGKVDEESKDSLNDLELEKLKLLASAALTFEGLSLPYTESTIATYSRQAKWCSQIEDILNKLIEDKTRLSLHFKPMKPPQRQFIIELSKSYKLYAESQDREPKRSVFVKKDQNTMKPKLSLAEILPLYQLFKQSQKERKMKEFESRTTTRLVNISVDNEGYRTSVPVYTGFILRNLSNDVTTDELEAMFVQHLKPTLIMEPQYQIVSDDCTENSYALIYPRDYSSISENCVKDMVALVGHFDFLAKDNFVADSVELCNIADELPQERLATPALESEADEQDHHLKNTQI